jgi:hypothetical protein
MRDVTEPLPEAASDSAGLDAGLDGRLQARRRRNEDLELRVEEGRRRGPQPTDNCSPDPRTRARRRPCDSCKARKRWGNSPPGCGRTTGRRGGGNASHRHGGAGVAKDVRDKPSNLFSGPRGLASAPALASVRSWASPSNLAAACAFNPRSTKAAPSRSSHPGPMSARAMMATPGARIPAATLRELGYTGVAGGQWRCRARALAAQPQSRAHAARFCHARHERWRTGADDAPGACRFCSRLRGPGRSGGVSEAEIISKPFVDNAFACQGAHRAGPPGGRQDRAAAITLGASVRRSRAAGLARRALRAPPATAACSNTHAGRERARSVGCRRHRPLAAQPTSPGTNPPMPRYQRPWQVRASLWHAPAREGLAVLQQMVE